MEDNNNNLDCLRTYLDMHASVVVLGKIFHATNYSERKVEVQPFSTGHKSFHECPIVDVVMQNDYLRIGETYVLLL